RRLSAFRAGLQPIAMDRGGSRTELSGCRFAWGTVEISGQHRTAHMTIAWTRRTEDSGGRRGPGVLGADRADRDTARFSARRRRGEHGGYGGGVPPPRPGVVGCLP